MKAKLDRKLWDCWISCTASILRFDIIGFSHRFFEIESKNNKYILLKNLSEEDVAFISSISKQGVSFK